MFPTMSNYSTFVLFVKGDIQPRAIEDDPNYVTMDSGDLINIFSGFQSSWQAVFHMYFRYYNDEYQGRTVVNEDSRSYKFSPWYMITDEAHYFEVDWTAATFISENDGFFTFYIDGDLKVHYFRYR
jgi:hypothetical protein